MHAGVHEHEACMYVRACVCTCVQVASPWKREKELEAQAAASEAHFRKLEANLMQQRSNELD